MGDVQVCVGKKTQCTSLASSRWRGCWDSGGRSVCMMHVVGTRVLLGTERGLVQHRPGVPAEEAHARAYREDASADGVVYSNVHMALRTV